MGPEMKNVRTRRTWFDKLRMWQRAYETTIRDQHYEVIGRGPTPEASQEAAKRLWLKQNISTTKGEGYQEGSG